MTNAFFGLLMVLSVTPVFAQPGGHHGGDFIAGDANQFIQQVIRKVDVANIDEYKSAFRCPMPSDDRLGWIYTREQVKNALSNIHVDVTSKALDSRLEYIPGMTVQPMVNLMNEKQGIMISIQASAYGRYLELKQNRQALAHVLLQAICYDTGLAPSVSLADANNLLNLLGLNQ